MKNIGIITALLLFNSVPTLAHTDPHLEFSKVTTNLISVEERMVSSEEFLFLNVNENESITFQEGVDPMAIADIAFKIWDIIKDGKPVVNVQYKNANALPNIANRKWEALTGWKSERSMTFGVSTENAYGIKTVDLEYKVKLLYGGGVKGKGLYIASARVVPSKVDVKWGYNLDVSVEVPSILNLASIEDPLAAISMDVTYKISTILRSYSESNGYELRGNGMMKADNKIIFDAISR
jgi:hypothetical protein